MRKKLQLLKKLSTKDFDVLHKFQLIELGQSALHPYNKQLTEVLEEDSEKSAESSPNLTVPKTPTQKG